MEPYPEDQVPGIHEKSVSSFGSVLHQYLFKKTENKQALCVPVNSCQWLGQGTGRGKWALCEQGWIP